MISESSASSPNKYIEEYNLVLGAIRHFECYLPGVRPQEGNIAESQLPLTSGGLIYERLFPHFVIWNAEKIVTGKWKRTNIRTRFPMRTLPWNALPVRTFHHAFLVVKAFPPLKVSLEGGRIMWLPFRDLLSSAFPASNMSLLENAGLRAPLKPEGIALLLECPRADWMRRAV